MATKSSRLDRWTPTEAWEIKTLTGQGWLDVSSTLSKDMTYSQLPHFFCGDERTCQLVCQVARWTRATQVRNDRHQAGIFVCTRDAEVDKLPAEGCLPGEEEMVGRHCELGEAVHSAPPCKEIEWLVKEMEKQYELKFTMVGPEAGLSKDVRILNTRVRWTKDGIQYECDRRHADVVVGLFGH